MSKPWPGRTIWPLWNLASESERHKAEEIRSVIPRVCKGLAEVDFPIAKVSRRHSAREESIRHGYPRMLHLWWTRQPLAACRGVCKEFFAFLRIPSFVADCYLGTWERATSLNRSSRRSLAALL
jgi:hypothetical protein